MSNVVEYNIHDKVRIINDNGSRQLTEYIGETAEIVTDTGFGYFIKLDKPDVDIIYISCRYLDNIVKV